MEVMGDPLGVMVSRWQLVCRQMTGTSMARRTACCLEELATIEQNARA